MSSIGHRYELINSRLQLLKKGTMNHGEVLAEISSMMQEYGDTREREARIDELLMWKHQGAVEYDSEEYRNRIDQLSKLKEEK